MAGAHTPPARARPQLKDRARANGVGGVGGVMAEAVCAAAAVVNEFERSNASP